MTSQRSKIVTAITTLVIVFTYAILRYNIYKGVSWSELPLFISNKAISLSAVVFISLSYLIGSLSRFWPKLFSPLMGSRKFFGLFGFGLAALHGLISLLIFSPSHYPKFFSATGQLNLVGELSMLFGVLGFFVFSAVALSSIPQVVSSMDQKRWMMVQRLGYLGLLLVFFHVFSMGIEGWLKPSGWPGGLLPISLVAAIIIAFTLLLKLTALIFFQE